MVIRILETDHDGTDRRLRFRRVVFSIARQNGKSEICSVLALYALLQHSRGGSVIGIATNVKSAQIVYQRVCDAIKADKALSKRLKTTTYRGIRNLETGSTYNVMPAKSDALQGHTVSAMGIVDEVHVVPEQLWDDLVKSASAHPNALIVGLTTAGDPDSTLLIRLYKTAETELTNPETTWGFFIYEGIEGRPVDDEESLLQANPIVACGRKTMASLLDEIQGQPKQNVIRYSHNLFVSSVEDPYIPIEAWDKCAGQGITERKNLVYGFEVTPSWSYATVTVARKRDDGIIETQVLATIVDPDLEQLKRIAKHLKSTACAYVMDTKSLNDLYVFLKDKGYSVHNLNNAGYLRMAGMFYALVTTGKVSHKRDPILTSQLPFARTKNYAGGISIAKGIKDIDAVKATAAAVWIANTQKARVLQLF